MRLIKNDRLDFFFLLLFIYLFILLINYFGLIKKKIKIKKKNTVMQKTCESKYCFYNTPRENAKID